MAYKQSHRAQYSALILCFLLLAFAGTLIVGTATAQETASATSTETPANSTNTDIKTTETESTDSSTDTQTPEETGENRQNSSYEFVFSDSLRLVNSHWEGKTFVATIEADRPARITVTDAGRESDDNENVVVDRETFTVSSTGTTSIRFTVVEDRQVTLDDGNTLLLKGYSNSLASPDVHTLVSATIGVLVAFLLIIENARRTGKLSKRRIEEA